MKTVRSTIFIFLGSLLLLLGCQTVPLIDLKDARDAAGQGMIAFSSDRDGNFDIYVMRPDGSFQTKLADRNQDDNFPEFAPGGQYIMFIEHTRNPPTISLWTIRSDGSQPMRLATGLFANVAWSPDGHTLAIDTYVAGAEAHDIFTLDGTTGSYCQLTTHPNDGYEPRWSPDGTQIVFASTRTGSKEIFVMNRDGTAPRQLTDLRRVSGEPSWSPDGSKIAFYSGDWTNNQIYVMNANGTHVVQLTDSAGYNCCPRWSPDGMRIVFWSTRSGKEQIWVMNADGSYLTRLTNNNFNDENPTWSW